MDYRDRLLLLISFSAGIYSAIAGWMKLGGVAGAIMALGFGVSSALSLILLKWGKEVLWKKGVVLLSCLYPLGLILSLVWKFFPEKRLVFALFAVSGLLFVLVAHTYSKDWGSFAVALVHAGAGLGLFPLPVVLKGRGLVASGFQWFSLGVLTLSIMGFGLLHFFSKDEEHRISLFLEWVPAALALSSVFYAAAIHHL